MRDGDLRATGGLAIVRSARRMLSAEGGAKQGDAAGWLALEDTELSATMCGFQRRLCLPLARAGDRPHIGQ